jgi:hypothetical protein
MRSPTITARSRDSGERGRDDLALLDAGAVEVAADHELEVPREIEVLEDALGEHRRLRRRQRDAPPLRAQPRQQLGNARVDLVLVQAAVGEVLAIVLDRALRLVGREAERLLERLVQRRADQRRERVRVGRLEAALAQRVLDRARDARLGIGERPVEVEQHCAPGANAPPP